MSADKPTGGDSFPDRGPGIDDKPFPGAPENREPAPVPGNAPSMEYVRAMHQKAGSNAEFEAMAKADAQAAEFPDQEPSREGSATASRDEADDPEGRPPEAFTRSDSELPPFPGPHDNREPAPNARSAEDVRAVPEKTSLYGEPEAMPTADAAAAKEILASRPGQEIEGSGGSSGWIEDAGNADAGEHGDDADREKDAEGQDRKSQEQKPKDQVLAEHPSPSAETARPTETSSESAPDQQPDDPRLAAMEQQMNRILAAVETMQAKLEASETWVPQLM